jgi:predicted nucleic acid-binding protein
MRGRFLDSNIILRYLLGEPKASSVEKLLKERRKLILLDIVFAEVIWTLTRFYKWRKDRVISFTSSLLKIENILANKKLLLTSLEIYKNHNVKYTDAYIAASMIEKGARDIYSFDRDFEKISGVRRIEPK